MKNFVETIKNSIWSPVFYKEMSGRSLHQAVGYFLSLVLASTFVAVVVISIEVVPGILTGSRLAADLMATRYPADLVVNFSNGEASTVVDRVYAIELPSELYSSAELSSLRGAGINNFLVIDTSANFDNQNQLEKAETLILLSKNSIVTKKKGGGYEVTPIVRDFRLTVDKNKVGMWSEKILPAVRILIPVGITFMFLGMFMGLALIYYIFAQISAFVIWLVSRLWHQAISLRQASVTSLYAISLSVLFDLLLIIFGLGGALSFGRSLLVVVLVWLMNTQIWKKPNLPAVSEGPSVPMIKQ